VTNPKAVVPRKTLRHGAVIDFVAIRECDTTHEDLGENGAELAGSGGDAVARAPKCGWEQFRW